MAEAGICPEIGVSKSRRVRLAAALILVAVAAAACGSGSKKASSESTSTTVAEAPTTTTTTLETKIFADLDAYNAMYRGLLESPDPSSRELNDHMQGPTIAQFRTFMVQLQQAHKHFQGPSTNKYRLVSVDGTNAVVHECTDEQGHWHRDGQQLPDEPGQTGRLGSEVKLVLDGGTWKVFNVADLQSACPA